VTTKKQNLTGHVYGRLTVVMEVTTSKHSRSTWRCKCSCGAIVEVWGNALRTGNTKSCGCLSGNEKHGHAVGSRSGIRDLAYISWKHMRQRCFDPGSSRYLYYGGKGVTVCDRWSKFSEFLKDMGPRPTINHSLERKDPNGHYTPENCEWITKSENTARSNKTRHSEKGS
jgi:hypothetical protein